MSGPCANYKNYEGVEEGFTAVGEGWWPILETLDMIMSGYEGKIDIKVVQIKEKFGALRVYYGASRPEDFNDYLHSELEWEACRNYIRGAVTMAELISSRTCMTCGTKINPQPAPRKPTLVPIRALCKECR